MAKSLEFLDLDFFDPKDVLIAVSYGSVDFRDIGKRKGTFSKTIKMPATKSNDAFFGYSFGVTNEGFFDNKIKVPIKIDEIGFTGTLQLKSVEVLNRKPQSYSVNIFSDLADWASLVGEGSIRELKHHGEHILGADVIKDSWSNNGLTGDYVYPLISYGNFLQDRPSTYDIDVSLWRPAFFSLPLIRQIFLEAGFTFDDSDIKNTPFRDHILPFTSKEVELPNLDVAASGNATGSITTNNTNRKNTKFSSFDINYATESSDLIDIFNHQTGRLTAPSTDNYEINVSVSMLLIGADIRAIQTPKLDEHGSMAMRLEATDNSEQFDLTAYSNYGDGATFTQDDFSLFGTKTVRLTKGKTYQVVLSVLQEPRTTLSITFDFDADISIKPKLSTLVDGSPIDHSKVIQNIKKIDLLRDVMNQGNFRVFTDNLNKTVRFIQEDDFLLEEVEDWTSKVDVSRPSTIKQMQNEGAKELVWAYSNDSDDGFISDATDRIDEDWAKKKVQMDSEYRKGVKTVYQSIFSSTVDGVGIGVNVPIMSTQEIIQGEPIERGTFETNFENRCLIYGGLQPGVFVIDGEQQNQYPYCYFESDSFTLNWNSINSVGLVDRYWNTTIRRLNNSKMLTQWINLNELDISNLSFRKAKIIDGIHYYLNMVKDYKVNANQSTMVELISK